MSEALPAALYQGSANTWECDEMGHLNVRFHVERAFLGLAALTQQAGMARAFIAEAGSTVTATDLHIRFLKEARPGAPLAMRGGVVEIGDSDAAIYTELRHIDGSPSSTCRMRIAHAEPRTLAAFPWTRTARAGLEQFRCAVPAHGAPRSIDLARPAPAMSLKRADELGAMRTGRSMVQPAECDAFGRMRGEMFIARVSDAVPWLLTDWRIKAAAAAKAIDGVERQPGGAAVEFRILIRKLPRAGDHIEVRSAIVEVLPKANRIVHWLLDPVTGEGWASVEAMALSLDLISRKAFFAPDALRDELAQSAVTEMSV